MPCVRISNVKNAIKDETPYDDISCIFNTPQTPLYQRFQIPKCGRSHRIQWCVQSCILFANTVRFLANNCRTVWTIFLSVRRRFKSNWTSFAMAVVIRAIYCGFIFGFQLGIHRQYRFHKIRANVWFDSSRINLYDASCKRTSAAIICTWLTCHPCDTTT